MVTARIAAGVDNQDAHTAKNRLSDLGIGRNAFGHSFATQHLSETQERAAATANTPAACVRHHEHVSHTGQPAVSTTALNLQVVRRGLRFVCSGNDEILPRSGCTVHAARRDCAFELTITDSADACQRTGIPSIPPGAAGSLRVDSRTIRFGSSIMLFGCGGVFASITDSTSFPARSPIATLC